MQTAIARLKKSYVYRDDRGSEVEAEMALELADQKILCRIIEAFKTDRVRGGRERFSMPPSSSIMKPGYFRMEETAWKKRLAEALPSLGKDDVHYVNSAGFWLVLAEIAQRFGTEEETGEDDRPLCLAFSFVFSMIAKNILTMRMDFYHVAVSHGPTFAEQMAKSIEFPDFY